MSLPKWQIENSLCRCCHSEGSYVNLAEPRIVDGETEIYSKMLQECFNIMMSPVQGPLQYLTYTICEDCVLKVRDALSFKQQILECEKTFENMYSNNCIMGSDLMEKVKVEMDIINDGIKQETTTHRKWRKPLNADESSSDEPLITYQEYTTYQDPLRTETESPTQTELQLTRPLTKWNLHMLNESPEARERRLERHRKYNATRRRAESPNTRALRLAQVREASNKRRREESPESREYRLAQARQYHREVRSVESETVRQHRLDDVLQITARRRRAESPNSRALRLARQREYNERRRGNESPRSTELRHAQMREAIAKRRSRESPNTREARLEKQRQYSENRRRQESPASREIRLAKQRKFNEKRRTKQKRSSEHDSILCSDKERFDESQPSSDSQYTLPGTANETKVTQKPHKRPCTRLFGDTHEGKATTEPPIHSYDLSNEVSHNSESDPTSTKLERGSFEWTSG